MASIRRTLSPVPRAGAKTSGEACSVASPLSKSSSHLSNFHSSVSSCSSVNSLEHSLYRMHAFILGFFSHRLSRPLERSNPKGGQVWRRALLHFIICFLAGLFTGLTPFGSMKFLANLKPKHEIFLFEMIPSVARYQSTEVAMKNVKPASDTKHDNLMPSLERWDVVNDGSTEQNKRKSEVETVASELLTEDLALDLQKLLIVVTPTSTWPLQEYYLYRLAQTLKLVHPPLLWIVVEMTSQSEGTAEILRRTGVMYRHLVCNQNATAMNDAYTHQRNLALSHIETHHLDGIVYFTEENYIYSVNLFEQLRQISRFGTWNVAKVSPKEVLMDGPVCNQSEVIGWNTNEMSRRFHADISGFAFNSTILWDPQKWHRPTLEPIRYLGTAKKNLLVSTFIEQLVEDETQIEGLLPDCSISCDIRIPRGIRRILWYGAWIIQLWLPLFSLVKVSSRCFAVKAFARAPFWPD
ncbi:hypothetical protein Nepgr_012646 [Nepenthes gracilis]|uniref:Glycosyltransferases n=1 Tax=Nepenthes gracilis TaxID=150966 RepID=A0AAD3SG49_NEPGR|nr:hypothetical protein Nepgr_012646 [Nepenthes gracilis]